jgi:Domain of unknown function (DUF1707)
VTTGPGDETATGAGSRGHLRASHADREQVIGTLKAAFVAGMLTKDELELRVGQTLAARTYAELAALTADIPPAPAGPPAAGPASPPAPARHWPLAKAGAKSGGCLVFAFAAVLFAANVLDPNGLGNPYAPWSSLCALAAMIALVAAVCFLGQGVVTSLEQRSSRRQLPPRPGPGRLALDGEQGDSTGHGPVPPSPGDGQACTDLRAHKPRQRLLARAAGTTRRQACTRRGMTPVKPAPGTVRPGFPGWA